MYVTCTFWKLRIHFNSAVHLVCSFVNCVVDSFFRTSKVKHHLDLNQQWKITYCASSITSPSTTNMLRLISIGGRLPASTRLCSSSASCFFTSASFSSMICQPTKINQKEYKTYSFLASRMGMVYFDQPPNRKPSFPTPQPYQDDQLEDPLWMFPVHNGEL